MTVEPYGVLRHFPPGALEELAHELGMAAAYAASLLPPARRADVYNMQAIGPTTRLALIHYRAQLPFKDTYEAPAAGPNRSPDEPRAEGV